MVRRGLRMYVAGVGREFPHSLPATRNPRPPSISQTVLLT